MTLKPTTTRAQLSTSSEDLAVQMGKINKWYESLVPTGGETGNILGWNSDGTAKWVTVAPSANKLNVASAVGGTTQPVYFKADGTPEAISFTIGKSVPANAVFTDQNVKSTLLGQATSEASYRPTFVTGATTGGVYIIDSYKVNHTPGTTSAVGNTRLVLGNATASGTANNEEGQIKLYSPGTAFHTIKGTTISSEAVHVFPSTGGTILNTGTTSYTQTVASSATGAYEIGKIKINGTTTTIYGKDTDTKVKVTSNTASKAYLIATTTAPAGTAVEGVGDANVYMSATDHYLTAPGFSTTTTNKGYYAYDSTSTRYALIFDNGSNLWIGTDMSVHYPHNGQTFISTGWTGTLPTSEGTLTGYDTIRISVPKYTVPSGSTTGTWDHTNYYALHTGNTSFTQTLSSGTKIGTIKINGTSTDIYCETNTNTDTKVNVTLGTTTKAYLLGTSTTPTSTAQAVTSIADTGVYLGTAAGSLFATTFYENGTALSSKYAALSHSHDNLTSKALTAATFDSTSGNFFFKGDSLFGGTDNADWVGIQGDASNDKFQLVAGGGNGVFFRESDDTWSDWYALLTNTMITGSSGITVTPHTIKIGGDNGTTINGGVTISHSNSITAQTSTVFKKFSYDANGHITGVANVAASDITALGIVGTDEHMTQTNTTGSAAYRVLLSGNANDNNETTTGRKSSKLTFNPSTGALTVSGPATATNFFGKLTQISGATPSGRVTSADITGGTAAQYNDASMQLILATSSMTTGKPANDGYIMHYNWDNAGICRAQFFIADNNVDDAVQYRTQGSAQQTWGAQPWTTLLSEKNAFTWSRLCDRFYITPTEPGFLRILTLGSEEQNGRVMGSVKITISTDYNDYPPEIVCFEVMNVYKAAPAIHVLKSIQLGEKTSATHVITLVRLLKNSTGTQQYVEIYYNGESGKHINFSVRYEVFVPYETFDREAIPISMPNNNTTLTVSPTTPTSDVILNDPTVIPKEVSYNMMRIGDHWGIATPVGTLNLPFATGLSGSDIEWVRTTRRGFLPYQSRSAGAGNTSDTSGGACYLGTSTWYFARAYIENTVGSLGTFQASSESDIPTSTGYQNGTMSFLQTLSSYGGTDYRSGNSGSYWWAHYLTFKQNSSYRYILRLPFWGVPQYQYTTNGADQRWRTFITDENLDSARLGTEVTSVVMQTATPIPRIMAPLFQFHRANKFAFMPADKITIESSTDSGSTWQTYSVTDAVKRSLFISKTAGAAIMVGPKSSATRTASMRTRIIVECDGRDVIIDRLLFLISSNASSIAVDVKIALSSAPTTYIPIVTNGTASGTYAYEYLINLKHQSGTETIGGVSNVPKNYRFKTNNVLKFVFEFRYVSVSNTSYIGGILGYSGTYWDNDTTYTNKSYFAQHDHIYDWDVDQNATFPANVYTKTNLVTDHDLILRTSSNDDPKWYAYNDNGVNMNIIRKQGSVEGRVYTISEKSGSNLATTKLYNNGTGASSITTDSNSDQFLYFIVTVKHPGMTNSVTSVMIPASQSTSNVTHGCQWVDTPQGYTKILGGTITYKYNTSNTNYTFSVTAASQATQAGSSSVAVTGTAVITRVMGFGLLVLGDFA